MLLDKNTLEKLKKLLEDDNINDALSILNKTNDKSIWCQNARGVCLMRMGKYKQAVTTLTPLVFPGGSVIIGLGVPEKVKLNLAEAMLLTGNVSGAVSLIQNVKEDSVQLIKLEQTIKRWKKSLSLFARLEVWCGILPYDGEVQVDAPYGEL